MTQPPTDAQRSPDGHYWWDANSNAWQAVPGGAADTGQSQAPNQSQDPNQSQEPNQSVDPGQSSGPQNGELTIDIGPVTDVTHTHDEVVAMLEQAGSPLPEGQAYA